MLITGASWLSMAKPNEVKTSVELTKMICAPRAVAPDHSRSRSDSVMSPWVESPGSVPVNTYLKLVELQAVITLLDFVVQLIGDNPKPVRKSLISARKMSV